MVVDLRRDHSIRVPRPDLSITHGTPNACDQCHADKGMKWQADAMARWIGKSSRPMPSLLAATDKDARVASRAIRAGVTDTSLPGIVRATFASRLEGQSDAASQTALRSALQDPDALVRATAAKSAASNWPPDMRAQLLAPLLNDPVKAVRIEAARALADVPDAALAVTERQSAPRDAEDVRARADVPDTASASDLQSTRRAAEGELIAAERANAERPEAHLNLASYIARKGDLGGAEESLRTAIRLDPAFIPAYVNLADVLRAAGRDADAEGLLNEALRRAPQSAPAVHALGLLKARGGDMESALRLLERATKLAPDDSRYGYVYAMGLQSAQRFDAAVRELERVQRRAPADKAVLLALAAIQRDLGHRDGARRWLDALLALDPQDPDARALRESL
jgi:tetratricopeptide (TPR) repeat protein